MSPSEIIQGLGWGKPTVADESGAHWVMEDEYRWLEIVDEHWSAGVGDYATESRISYTSMRECFASFKIGGREYRLRVDSVPKEFASLDSFLRGDV